MTQRRLGRALERIGDAQWGRVGLAMGLLACVSIASQLVHELSSRTPSRLSWPFLLGFAFVYAFWFYSSNLSWWASLSRPVGTEISP